MYWEKIWQLRFFRAVTITIFYFMLFLGTAQAQEKEMSEEMHTGHRQKMRIQWTEKIKLPDKTMKIRKTISAVV